MSRRRPLMRSLALVVILAFLPVGAVGGPASIKSDDLKEWLSFIASDDTQGRAVFSAGLGLAAAYISDHLRVWGVKPGGDHSSYLQTVRVLGVKSTSRSTVTVKIGNDSRTFADNDALIFPRNPGENSVSPSIASSLPAMVSTCRRRATPISPTRTWRAPP